MCAAHVNNFPSHLVERVDFSESNTSQQRHDLFLIFDSQGNIFPEREQKRLKCTHIGTLYCICIGNGMICGDILTLSLLISRSRAVRGE